MVWSRHEKELTAEEAIMITRDELAPYWYGVRPLLVGLEKGGAFQAFPLDSDFIKQTWMIIAVDPTTYLGSSVMQCVSEWDRRYRTLGLNILLIYAAKYEFQRNGTEVQRWMREEVTSCVRCFDVNSGLIAALRVKKFPTVVLFKSGKKSFEVTGDQWIYDTDLNLQKVLRADDPGLPLSPVMPGIDEMVQDSLVQDFGSTPAHGDKFDLALPGIISFSGVWQQKEDRIFTSDPSARMEFKSLGSEIAILAKPQSKSDLHPSMIVEVNELAPYDTIRGSDLRVSENSDLVATIEEPKLYHVLVGLPEHERNITIRFQYLKEAPIELFGIRFANRMKVSN